MEGSRALADVSNTHHPATAAGLNNKACAAQKPSNRWHPVITSSGFRGAAKQQLHQLASQFGATYSGELVQGRTTHLVTVSTAAQRTACIEVHLYVRHQT
jgi:hypothetical protein